MSLFLRVVGGQLWRIDGWLVCVMMSELDSWNGMEKEEELIYIYMCVFLLTRHRLMGYGSDPVGSASPSSSSHALKSAGLGVSACKGVVIGWHCYEQVSAMRFFFTWHENRWSGDQWVQGSRHRVAPFLKPVNAINSSSHVLVWVQPGQRACHRVALPCSSQRYKFFFTCHEKRWAGFNPVERPVIVR